MTTHDLVTRRIESAKRTQDAIDKIARGKTIETYVIRIMKNIGHIILFFVASAVLLLCVYTVLTAKTDLSKAINTVLCAVNFIYMQRAWAKITSKD